MQIKKHWENMKNTFPDERTKVWDTLEKGLMKYLQVLKERSQIFDECQSLQQQNKELEHLLQKFLMTKSVKKD
jgi:hypothetical protein